MRPQGRPTAWHARRPPVGHVRSRHSVYGRRTDRVIGNVTGVQLLVLVPDMKRRTQGCGSAAAARQRPGKRGRLSLIMRSSESRLAPRGPASIFGPKTMATAWKLRSGATS
jgi:hypothetical protein